MSFSKIARRCVVYLPLAIFVAGPLIYVGCSGGVTGEGFRNSPPTVRYVNTPPAGSVFSRNELISWVGADIDGRVVEFRYVVVLRDSMFIPNGLTSAEENQFVDQFAQALPADLDYVNKWISRVVTLDDPANSDVVAMTADFDDPVKKVVEQSMFLYAIDDKGDISRVAIRQFGRRNHHPDTRLEPFLSPYVNVQSQQFATGGVPTVWFGSDDLDFPGEDEPPLEFEWKLFGPYTQAESTRIIDNFTEVVFVTTEKTYELDVDILYDTIFDFTKADSVYVFDTLGDSELIITVAIGTITVLDVTLANADTLKALKRDSHFDTVLILDSMLVLDTIVINPLDTIPDTVVIERTIETSFNPFTGERWVKDGNATFLDVYRNDNRVGDEDTTRELTFLFWVRSRDDAFVPDPTPSFGIFNVIEAKHERDLLVIDYSTTFKFKNINGIWAPCSTDDTTLYPGVLGSRLLTVGQRVAKEKFSVYISKWRQGFVGGTNDQGFDTGSFNCTDDIVIIPGNLDSATCNASIFSNFSSPDYMFIQGFGLSANSSFFAASLRDVLKHKVVIFLKEHVSNAIPMKAGSAGETFLLSGVLDGVNFWTMARSPFIPRGFSNLQPEVYQIADIHIPIIYASIFGIRGGIHQAWYGMSVFRDAARVEDSTVPPVERNEDFIGAAPSEFFSASEFPELTVDPDRLRSGLRWVDTFLCKDSKTHYPFLDSIAALPEVGFTVPITIGGAQAIYLYKSLYGEQEYPFWNLPFKDYEGTVVAVRRNAGLFRASHWQFTPNVLEEASFQIAFNTMLDWLFQPWGGPTFGVAPLSPPEARTNPDRELRNLAAYMEQKRQATIREIMPPGQRYITNQIEFNQYLKEWQYMKRAEAEALAASPYEY